ncbi:LAMI_0G11320g1_1 [Lachancea mirantina]|uniref:LAMI_0G11320g1_1 n=1 Tax=Lachancea mirantina TaxID=1230905 RepID=A0A1G4KAX5_9SACH|nr:LAMI_0G11320g1_1 [Lachancea mirantina]
MTTVLQLLAKYYDSVIKSEQIYSDYIRTTESGSSVKDADSMFIKETISLKHQLAQLITDLNQEKRENERLRELHKTQIAFLESKLDSAKRNISKLKDQNPDTNGDDNNDKNSKALKRTSGKSNETSALANKFHLLSPINRGSTRSEAMDETDPLPKKAPSGLRQAIYNRHQTLFDDDTNDGADKTDEFSFMNSIKHRGKLAELQIPDGKLPSSSGNDETELPGPEPEVQKKRKLIRKRIHRDEDTADNVF